MFVGSFSRGVQFHFEFPNGWWNRGVGIPGIRALQPSRQIRHSCWWSRGRWWVDVSGRMKIKKWRDWVLKTLTEWRTQIPPPQKKKKKKERKHQQKTEEEEEGNTDEIENSNTAPPPPQKKRKNEKKRRRKKHPRKQNEEEGGGEEKEERRWLW